MLVPRLLYRYSYFVSAKTGDNVAAAFYRVAADLAGVVLTKPEVEVASSVVKAQIVNHPTRNDDDIGTSTAPQRGKCAIM